MPTEYRMVQEWFRVAELEPGILDIWEPFQFDRVHSYLVVENDGALLIDTGTGIGDIRALVEELTSQPVQVVNSHAHWDHIGGNWRFDRIAIHHSEAADLEVEIPNAEYRSFFANDSMFGPLPASVDMETIRLRESRATTTLSGGEIFDLGGWRLEVIHAPGHSRGGIVLVDRDRGVLFSTDVAYPDPLYCFGPDTDIRLYHQSLTTLAELAPGLNVVYPSHGLAPMDVSLLQDMVVALERIMAGRAYDQIEQGTAMHQFDGFSVRVPLPSGGSTQR